MYWLKRGNRPVVRSTYQDYLYGGNFENTFLPLA